VSDVNLGLQDAAKGGLGEGQYIYRVSAIFDPSDTDNPGGESLASDPFTIKLPPFPNKKIEVTLSWKAPVDVLGAAIPNVVGYRIYRSAQPNGPPGSEVLLETLNDPNQLDYTDTGADVPGTEKPLPLGSIGRWADLPLLGTPRSGPAVAAAFDPDPGMPNTFYVYALLGRDSANTVTASYEYLTITVLPNGHQTFGGSWTAGATPFAAGRWQLGAWRVDQTVQSNYAGQAWIFAGTGRNAADSGTAGSVEAAEVQSGGQLGSFTVVNSPNPSYAGYGVCAANQQLFSFGGKTNTLVDSMKSSTLYDNQGPFPPPQNGNWNDQGVKMTEARYLLGSTVQSSFIFLLGGQTGTSTASTTTELVIW
jgi:hypothetical protein